jgi:hypothetical protein
MAPAVCNDHLIIFGEIRDLVDKVIDGSAVAVDDEQRFPGAIYFALHFETADTIEFSGSRVFAIGNGIGIAQGLFKFGQFGRRIFLGEGCCGEEKQQQGEK